LLSIDILLFITAILILISILLAKLTHNIGMPTMLLFIGVGILAGSEGLGGIYFDDAALAQSIVIGFSWSINHCGDERTFCNVAV
jgi:cell volume regulation protein A